MKDGFETYGALPMFPCLTYVRPITMDRIERTVERLVDNADASFMAGGATQAQYDAWNKALNAWTEQQYRLIRAA